MAAGPNHQRKYPVERSEDLSFQIERDDRIDWDRKQKHRRERPDFEEFEEYDLDDFTNANGGFRPKNTKSKRRRRTRDRMRPKRDALLDDFYDEEADFY